MGSIEIRLDDYELDDIDKRILQYRLAYPGMKSKDIAERCKISTGVFLKRIKRPAYLKATADINRTAIERVIGLVDRAAKKYEELLDCGDLKIEERVAKSILVSAGVLKEGTHVTVNNNNATLESLVLLSLQK